MLYLTFIRHLLDYACEVWDNCRIINEERLERIQLDEYNMNIHRVAYIYTNNDYIWIMK